MPDRFRLPVLSSLWLCLMVIPLMPDAQPGLSEFRQVRKEVNDWFYWVTDLIFVIGAVAGILGGARVYANWQAGRRHVDQEVIGWFLACVFLNAMAVAIRVLYGVN